MHDRTVPLGSPLANDIESIDIGWSQFGMVILEGRRMPLQRLSIGADGGFVTSGDSRWTVLARIAPAPSRSPGERRYHILPMAQVEAQSVGVPEPATLGFVGVALCAGLVMLIRRRRSETEPQL
jgi:hypothetical protein